MVKRAGITSVLALALVVAVGSFSASAGTNRSAHGPHGKRLKIVFDETRLSIHEPPGLGMRQVIASGVGTFEGFGPATEIVAVSQDLTVAPCGVGSNTSTILRRIVVPQGTLVVKSLAHRCPAPFGILATGRYEIDGASSTGIFAGARGRGSDIIEIEPPPNGPATATLTGKLRLAK
jgi:hypothetical protein